MLVGEAPVGPESCEGIFLDPTGVELGTLSIPAYSSQCSRRIAKIHILLLFGARMPHLGGMESTNHSGSSQHVVVL